MSTTQKPISFDDAVFPTTEEPSADVLAWQAEKIRAGLADADAGRFASKEEIRAIIQKFVPNG